METSKEFKEAVRTIPPSNYFGQTRCSTTSFPKITADLQHIIAYMRMQDYAGGGLSVFTGFSAFAASTSKCKYLLSKFDDKVLSYGIQANVADFAYAKSQATTSKRASAAGAKGAVLANAKASAMFAGGLFNSGVALMAGELTDGYTLAQAFVGGALVGYAGTSYFAKTKAAKKAGLTSKYLFGKGSQLGIDGAWTAAASDFAFSDRADYGKKSFGDHLLTGFAGFTGGLFSGMALTSNLNGIDYAMGRKLAGGSMLFGAYAIEYSLLAIGKGNYEKFYRKGWEKKGTIAVHKALYYSLITNW